MSGERNELSSADGTRLSARRDRAATPWGTLFLLHGLGEHSGRYGHVVRELVEAGLSVYRVDLRGHGLSAGRRGHVDRWHDYVADVAALFNWADVDEHQDRPWFLLGHSMGGLVAVHAALAYGKRLSGLILSGPALGVAAQIPMWKRLLAKAAANVLPALAQPNGLNPDDLSHDRAVVAAYNSDPLVHDRVTARWFVEFEAAMAGAQARAGDLKLPLLLLHGGDDPITDPEASRRFAARYGGAVDLHILAGMLHEVFNEVERAKAIGLVTSWLTARRP